MTTRTQVQESQPTSVRQLLRAYDVHQSGQEDDDVAEAIHHNRPARPTQPQPSQPDDTGLPSHLDDDVNTRRAVPVYRAVGDHTLASRPGGQNRVEGAFATFAFVGVYTMGVRVSPFTSHQHKF